MISSFVTRSPADCTRTSIISKARPPIGTTAPSNRSVRFARSISHPENLKTGGRPFAGTANSRFRILKIYLEFSLGARILADLRCGQPPQGGGSGLLQVRVGRTPPIPRRTWCKFDRRDGGSLIYFQDY